MTTRILGISAYYHDSAACLLVDGEIVAAAQEERFTRKKHDDRFPTHAIAYCLNAGGISVKDLDLVGFHEKPIVKFERLLETYVAYAPRGLQSFLRAMPLWLNEKLWMSDTIRRELDYEGPLLFGDHHESHAASAFYPSPFEEAAVLTMDAVGEWATAAFGFGKGRELTLLQEMRFPHSLGLLYSAFTYFAGFKVNSGEYKVMGLAPYGEPRYVSLIRDHLVDLREDGSVWLNMDYFEYCTGLTMTGRAFERLLGGPPRKPEGPITQREMNLARSIQEVTEEAMLKMARHVHRQTRLPYVCLAGGVALNCVGNGRILREGPFKEMWVQPAAGDAGGALGVAMALWHRYLGKPRLSPEREGAWRPATNPHGPPALVAVAAGGERVESAKVASAHEHNGLPAYADRMSSALLGPAFSEEEIGAWLARQRYPAKRFEREALAERIAELLEAGKVIGLFQSRMEFGPRALGARSIIGDARSPQMQSLMNLKIKFRESFRPFAPAVLREHVAEWFAFEGESPYMLLVCDVASHRRRDLAPADTERRGLEQLKVMRSDIPAVTHVDYSARIQTVRREHNPLFYDILRAFYERTGCPVIINTSFNVRGEPIVCTPEDAYRCFMRTQMDALVLETFVLEKTPSSGADEGGRVVAGEQKAVTSAVAQFYRELPFNYHQMAEQTAQGIRMRNEIARVYPRLDERLRQEGPTVLDIGCGTGWFVNTVACHYRLPVVGIDLCEPALERARAVAASLGVEGLTWYDRVDLFDATRRPGQLAGPFGLVNSLGVLHHTYDCREALQAVAKLVAPEGYLHLGLYHRYGRRPFLALFQAYREVARDPDRVQEWRALEAEALARYQELNPSITDPTMLRSWFRDQVLHPHESQHTLEEVHGWLAACGFTCEATSINRFRPVRDWRILFEEEKRLEAISYQWNVKKKRCFPGFFVVLAKRAVGSYGEGGA